MYSTAVLKDTYTRNYHSIKAVLKDINDKESRINPQPEGNNINWTLGHIVGYRSVVLATLGQAPFWDEESFAPYNFKSPPLALDKGMPLAALMEHLDTSQAALMSAFDDLDDDFFELSDGESSVGKRIDFFAWHEGYHLGQLALLRRIIGKGSAFE